MTYLTALSLGYAIPDTDFDATIHSVFRSAVNLRPVDGDLLLTLVVSDKADLPQGIRLDTPPGFSFEILQPGGRVVCRDYFLSFENANLTIDLRGVERWQSELPAIDLSDPVVSDAWEFVWQALNKRQMRLGAEIVAEALLRPGEMAQSAIARKMGEAVRSLVDAARRYELDASSILTRLIGLGSGLTPSGDDFLVSYLAGLWCVVQESAERRQFVSKLGEAIIHLSEQTNDISRTYLYHAAHGQVSSHLEALAAAISEGNSWGGKLLPIAETAMQSGHTSGMDAVAGLLFGLAAWDSRPGCIASER